MIKARVLKVRPGIYALSDEPTECETCEGTGSIDVVERWKADGSPGGRYRVTISEECPDCDGKGTQ